MGPALLNPILAADIGSILVFVFMLFSFFGWIGKQIKEANENAERAQGRGGGRGGGRGEPLAGGAGGRQQQPLQNEIDAFLQDVLGQRVQPEQPAEEDRQQREAERRRRQQQVAAREQEERRRQQETRQRQARKQRRRRAEDQPARQRERREEPVFEETAFGSEISSHVETYMSPHLQHLDSNVDQLVEQHFGKRLEESAASPASSPIVQELVGMLSRPAGMQQAILMNEILSKPKSRR